MVTVLWRMTCWSSMTRMVFICSCFLILILILILIFLPHSHTIFAALFMQPIRRITPNQPNQKRDDVSEHSFSLVEFRLGEESRAMSKNLHRSGAVNRPLPSEYLAL